MNKKIHLSLILLVLIFITTGCVATLPKNQLKFGAEAAQLELWDEAIFRWEKVVQSDPGSAAAHNNLAVAYEIKGCFEKAEREYKRALQLSPKNEQIQANYQDFKENLNKNQKEGNEDEKK